MLVELILGFFGKTENMNLGDKQWEVIKGNLVSASFTTPWL